MKSPKFIRIFDDDQPLFRKNNCFSSINLILDFVRILPYFSGFEFELY